MRVRMLQTHEGKESHPEHGELSLVYPAGSTQYFDDATATALIEHKNSQNQPAPIAIALPETDKRVCMLRSLTEAEVIVVTNCARVAVVVGHDVSPDDLAAVLASLAPQAHGEKDQRPALLPVGDNNFVFPNGEYVHFPTEQADALIGAKFAKAAPDEFADHIAATKAAAREGAIARKLETAAAEKKRAEWNAKVDELRTRRAGPSTSADAKASTPAAGSGHAKPSGKPASGTHASTHANTSASSTPAAAPSSTSAKEE